MDGFGLAQIYDQSAMQKTYRCIPVMLGEQAHILYKYT